MLPESKTIHFRDNFPWAPTGNDAWRRDEFCTYLLILRKGGPWQPYRQEKTREALMPYVRRYIEAWDEVGMIDMCIIPQGWFARQCDTTCTHE